MALPKTALDAFLRRPRNDFRPWKHITDQELNTRIASLATPPPLFKKLHRHQRVCFAIGAHTRRFGFLLSTGAGKTLLALALTRYFQKAGEITRVLVLVPNIANKFEWEREVSKHSRVAGVCVLHGSSAHKWDLLTASSALLTIETYAGLARMVCDPSPPNKKGHHTLVPAKDKVTLLCSAFDGLILDESTAVKNHQTLPFRICRQLSKTVKILYALTGTPFGRDPIDLWSQFYLIDRGEALGETLGLFREALFSKRRTPWGQEYVFSKKNTARLNRLMAHSSIRYEVDEVDLPAVNHIETRVTLPQEAHEYYTRARDTLIAAHGNYSEMKNAFTRMRQVSSGFFGVKDDTTGEKVQVEFDVCPKLEALFALLETITPVYKAVVFHDFLYSGRRITQGLLKRNIGFALLNGQTRDQKKLLYDFEHDARCRVLVLNSAAGGLGLNLQVARYGIYYESPLSCILRQQTKARIVRPHSEHQKVFIYDLITKDTVDEKILQYHKQGLELFKAIVDGAASLR